MALVIGLLASAAGCTRAHVLPPYVSDVDASPEQDGGASLPEAVCVPDAPLVHLTRIGGCATIRGRIGDESPDGACDSNGLEGRGLQRVVFNLLGPADTSDLSIRVEPSSTEPIQICVFEEPAPGNCSNCRFGCRSGLSVNDSLRVDAMGYASLTLALPTDVDFALTVCAN